MTLLSEVNALRENPRAYASVVASYASYYRHDLAAVDEALDVLRVTDPLPLLRQSDVLTQLAKIRTDIIVSDEGRLTHSDLGSLIMHPVLVKSGFRRLSENLANGYFTPQSIVVAWIIDSGVPSRGHRKNLLDPNINVAGESIRDGIATQIYGLI